MQIYTCLKGNKMSRCWCNVVLAILVIVFAWVAAPWTKIALTIVGALLVLKGLGGKCCCEEMMAKCEEKADQGGGEAEEQGEQE